MSVRPKNQRDSESLSFDWMKKSWGGLSQAAIWILGVISGFLLPPPVGISNDADKVWVRLAQFTVTVILGIAFIAARRWKKQRHVTKWWMVSGVLLVLSLATFVGYQALSYKWTCKYYNEVKIIGGDQHTPHGDDYIRNHPGISCEDLLKHHAGNVYDVWPKESIDRRRIALAVIYISCVPLFTICIVAVTQAIKIISGSK